MFIIAPNWKQPKYFKNKALACLRFFLPDSLPALNLVQNHQVGWSKAGISVSVCRALVHLSTGWSQIREQRASVGTMAGWQLGDRRWSLAGWGGLPPQMRGGAGQGTVSEPSQAMWASAVGEGVKVNRQWGSCLAAIGGWLHLTDQQVSECIEDNGIHVPHCGERDLQLWKVKKLK